MSQATRTLKHFVEQLRAYELQRESDTDRDTTIPSQTFASLVGDFGVLFQAAPLSDNQRYELLDERQCFANCLEITARQNELIYVEGFAVPPVTEVPVEHAWCATPEGL